MISIKSIDRHVRHGKSVGVCFVKTVQISLIWLHLRRFVFVRSSQGGGVGHDLFLVLVFAATRSQMALRSVLLIRIGKLNVEIKYIEVEIAKSKNELFDMSYILIYLCIF